MCDLYNALNMGTSLALLAKKAYSPFADDDGSPAALTAPTSSPSKAPIALNTDDEFNIRGGLATVTGWACTGSGPSTPVCSGSTSTWSGVVCISGNVVSISLSAFSLTGSIPSSLGKTLRSLYVLLHKYNLYFIAFVLRCIF